MIGKRILLVEDNPDDEALTLRALRKAMLAESIDVARDGVEALDYLFCTGRHTGRDASSMPHLVLLDLKLPKVDGLEVLRRLRQDARTKSLCVIVFTSSGEDEDIRRAYDLTANSFVRKPVAFEQFADAVSDIGRYWLRLNQSPVPPS